MDEVDGQGVVDGEFAAAAAFTHLGDREDLVDGQGVDGEGGQRGAGSFGLRERCDDGSPSVTRTLVRWSDKSAGNVTVEPWWRMWFEPAFCGAKTARKGVGAEMAQVPAAR
ncbi:hypothetical protein [Mycolicibacterium baixiangningiae]|uniref:hypothetical protein n=1 Tax=Mycolicibacterium baixiangningiae TaxID=2761578 RepID=UPI0018670267|nr:hypothetical protein [Mycolicibacterium baixiangningiae]